MSRPVYTMHPQSRYYRKPCGTCGHVIHWHRKFVLDPVKYQDGLPVVHHQGCYERANRSGRPG